MTSGRLDHLVRAISLEQPEQTNTRSYTKASDRLTIQVRKTAQPFGAPTRAESRIRKEE